MTPLRLWGANVTNIPEDQTMFAARLIGFALALAGACLLAVSTAQAAGTPEQQCQVAKNKAVGKYVACRQNVEAKLVASGNTDAYARSIVRCEYRFASMWEHAEAKATAVGATCLDAPLTEADFQAILTASTTNIATALAGLGLTDCTADLATCAGDLDTCTGDLGACTTGLAQTATDLTICNATVTTLSGNLNVCNGSLTTCTGSLGTCTSDLATANGSLGTCNLNLDACANDLGTCESDLVACVAAAALCANGTVEASEECDGADLASQTCGTRGFALGTLRCGSGCTFDTSGCFATRFVDNGDGTVTDHQTGLQWEKKTTTVDSGVNLADPHDVDNTYSWTLGGSAPNGTAFTDFLVKLNGATTDGVTLTGCFASHCDWRLPTIVELRTILLAPYPCGTSPCIAPVFGPTFAINLDPDYWSATADNSSGWAWFVRFDIGAASNAQKTAHHFVRAVRGGS